MYQYVIRVKKDNIWIISDIQYFSKYILFFYISIKRKLIFCIYN
jgi:hypothetical protein